MEKLLNVFYFLRYHTHHIHPHYNSHYNSSYAGNNDSPGIGSFLVLAFIIYIIYAIINYFRNK